VTPDKKPFFLFVIPDLIRIPPEKAVIPEYPLLDSCLRRNDGWRWRVGESLSSLTTHHNGVAVTGVFQGGNPPYKLILKILYFSYPGQGHSREVWRAVRAKHPKKSSPLPTHSEGKGQGDRLLFLKLSLKNP